MTPTRTPVQAVQHGLVILAVAWQGLWLVSEWLDGTWGVSIVVATAGWQALVTSIWLERFRKILITTDLTLLIVAMASLLLLESAEPGRGITGTTVLAGLIGLLIGPRIALPLIGLVTVAESVALTRFGPLGVDGLFGALYALAIGIGALLARLALVRGARLAMDVQTVAEEYAIGARAVEHVAADLRATERVVHATVLNTLTALGRGSASAAQITRERAAQAAQVLQKLTAGELVADDGVSLAQEIDHQAKRLRDAGVTVDVILPKRWPAVPDDVLEVFRGALDESVTNALRHAQAAHVEIRVTSAAGELHIGIRDDGVGFSSETPYRIGLKDVIFTAMAEVGGFAEVTSTARGTHVQLHWSEPSVRQSGAEQAQSILARFVTPLLFVFWIFTTLRVAITWDSFQDALVNGIAYALFTALVVFLAIRTRRKSLGSGPVIVVLLMSPLIYQLQKLGGSSGMWSEWASEAIAVLFIVLIGAGPAWVWPAAIGVWLLLQGNIRTEILAPGFAILLAIGLFAISFRRNASRAAIAGEALIANRAQETASQSVVTSIRRRADIAKAGEARALLARIASGEIDPNDASVRVKCIAEERLLRIAMRLDPARFALHAALGDLAVACYHKGVILDVDVAPTEVFDANADDFQSVSKTIVAQASAGDVLRVTTQRGEASWILLFVAEGDAFTDNVSGQQMMSVTHMPEERILLIEWRVLDATCDS